LFLFFYEETKFTFKTIVGSTSAPVEDSSGTVTLKQKERERTICSFLDKKAPQNLLSPG